MSTSDPPAATSRPALYAAVAALVLTTGAGVGAGMLLTYQALEDLKTQVAELSAEARTRNEKNQALEQALAIVQGADREQAGKLTDHEKRLGVLEGQGPVPVPPPKPDPAFAASLDARVGTLEKKLKDPSGKLVADGEIAKAIQTGIVVANKLKDSNGNLPADGEIGKAVRQVAASKEALNAINTRLSDLIKDLRRQ